MKYAIESSKKNVDIYKQFSNEFNANVQNGQNQLILSCGL
jgi:hypothetical protein